MINKIKKLLNRTFIKNVLIMATGTAVAQIIVFLFTPIITRLYGPEAYGVMGVFNSIIQILAPIAALTFPIAIVLPKEDDIAKLIARLSIFISLLQSLIVSVVLLFFGNYLINLFKLNEVSEYLYLIPLVIIFIAILQVLEQWLIRTNQFKVNAKVTFMHSLVTNASKVGFGLIKPVSSVLILITALSSVIKSIMILLQTKKIFLIQLKYKNEKINNTNQYRLLNIFKRYKDFPLYRAPETFINSISQGLPILMLSTLYGPISAGFYTIGRTVLGLPSNLIGKSIGDVFYPKITEEFIKNKPITPLIKKATIALFFLGIVPFGIVMIIGPQLFGLVFGEEWVRAGEYARWIAFFTFFGFVSKPCIKALPVLEAQKFHLLFTLIMLLVRVSVLLLSFNIYSSDMISIALFSIFSAILNFGLIFVTIRISKKKDVNRKTEID